MSDQPLDVRDDVASIRLIPAPIELLGNDPELNDKVTGQVLGLDLAAFFAPEADEGLFVPEP